LTFFAVLYAVQRFGQKLLEPGLDKLDNDALAQCLGFKRLVPG
jgi:hypothetical protein